MRLVHSLLLLCLALTVFPAPIAVAQSTVSAPALIGPADGSSGPASPVFEWGAVEGAGAYRIEVASDELFATLLASAQTSDLTYQEPGAFADGAILFWHVAVIQEGVEPTWSDTWSYLVESPATATPEPTATEYATHEPTAIETATIAPTSTETPTATSTPPLEPTATTPAPTTTPSPTATSTPKPVATPVARSELSGTIPASSGYALRGVGRSVGSVHPSVLTDRNLGTIWTSPATYPTRGYIIVSIDSVQAIGEIRWLFGKTGRADRIVIQVSTDRATWKEVGSARNAPVGEWQSLPVATNARYVRFVFQNIRGDRWLGGLVEIEVHPPKPAPTATPSPEIITPTPMPDGIVRNASFEIGRSPWYMDAGTYRSSRKVHGGALAIALEAGGGFADQVVDLSAGASYELSVWGALGSSYDVAYAGVVFRDSNNVRLTLLEPAMIEFSKSTYQQKSIQISVDPRVARVTVIVWKEAGGARFYADDIHIRKIDGIVPPEAPESVIGCQGLIVPGYFDPIATSLWQKTVASGTGVRMVIVNPNSGVGSRYNAIWSEIVAMSRTSGYTVLAYVQTDYGSRAAEEVIEEVDQYRTWYGIKDFFLDEAATAYESVETYRQVARNIHDGGGLAVLNFGWMPHPAYMQFTDVAGVFESNFAEYREGYDRPDWFQSYPAERFLHIIHSTPGTSWQEAVELSRQRNAGHIWITDDDTPSYYKSLPSFWSSLNESTSPKC